MGILVALAVLPFHSSAAENMVLNVTLNGVQKGDIFIVLADDGDVLVRVADLVAMGMQDPKGAVVVLSGDNHLSLRSVRELSYFYDDRKLTLSITAVPHLLTPSTVDLYHQPHRSFRPRENSLFLNYGLNFSRTDPIAQETFMATGKLGARSGDVLFLTDGFYVNNEMGADSVRLMSTVTYERRDDYQWFILGDMITDPRLLGSSVNMGGVALSKVYRVEPAFFKYPMFAYSGIAALPTQAEVYLDGVLVDQQRIAPGPFSMKNFNYYGGAHSIEVRLRDAYGREQRIIQPAYFTDQLLRKGLHEYSYNVGYLREGFGTHSSQYGAQALSAYHLYGIGDSVNIGAQAEAADGLYNAGGSMSFLVAQAGTLAVHIAGSTLRDRTGAAGSILHSYQKGRFIVRESISRFAEDYRTINTLTAVDSMKLAVGASVGYGTPSMGNVMLSYTGNSNHARIKRTIYSANFTRELWRAATMFVTVRSIRETATEYEIIAGFQYMFGQNKQVLANMQRKGTSNTESVRVQQNLPVGEGTGYHVAASRSDAGGPTTYSLNPHVQHNGRFGTYSIDAFLQNTDGETARNATLSAAGALVFAGGYFGLSRPVNDSFSVVLAQNLPDVDVLLNNVPITRTDADGRAIVPTVASYGTNRISVAMDNVPLGQSVAGIAKTISPSQWSGSCVSFEAANVKAVTGMLVLVQGGPRIPIEHARASIMVEDRAVPFFTGAGGEFYLENIIADAASAGVDGNSCRSIWEKQVAGRSMIRPGMYPATIEHQGQRCTFTLTFPISDDVMTDLGDVYCFPLKNE